MIPDINNDIEFLVFLHNHNIININFNTKKIKITNPNLSIMGYQRVKMIMLNHAMNGIREFSDRADRVESVNLFVELFKAIHSHKVIQ